MVVAQRVGIPRIMTVMKTVSRINVESIKTATVRSHPESLFILIGDAKSRDVVVTQAGRISRIMLITNHRIGASIQPAKSASEGTDPEGTGRIRGQAEDKVAAQSVRIIEIVSVFMKAIAIIAIQSILGCEPDKALSILQDVAHRVL